MQPDNTEARRDFLIREYGALNQRISEIQATMAAYAEQKAVVVRELRATGLSVIEIAERLGLTRQAIYNVLEAAGRFDDVPEPTVRDEGPRRFLVQHLDMADSRNGRNWTAWHPTLEAAMAAADLVYLQQDDTTLIRQEIIDTVTGAWRFRGGGSIEWSPPTRERVADAGIYGRTTARPSSIAETEKALGLS